MANQTPEQRARDSIDRELASAGWLVQDKTAIDLGAGTGVAVREYQTSVGPADYVLFVDRHPAGIIEAKRANEADRFAAHETQAEDYASAKLKYVKNDEPLPFIYESTGTITRFTDGRDPKPRFREVFSFHRPEELARQLRRDGPLRTDLRRMPPLDEAGLRECQVTAIGNLEQSFAENHPRALIHMATGSGKTFTAITAAYRLLKHAKAKRILFLVDTKNLGEQAEQEFLRYQPQDDPRLFPSLYNVQRLTSPHISADSNVVISTIQRLYSTLKGEPLDDAAEEEHPEERNGLDALRKEPLPVVYNEKIPPEFFDFIIIDECHRSIYNLWRQVVEYFDAFLVGLTATPDKRALGFFNKNVVSMYPHERAVADGVNVGYEVWGIQTEVTTRGGRIPPKRYVEKRERGTRRKRWEELDDELVYARNELDRSVVNLNQIRTVVQAFRDALPAIFPEREEAPKTLVFAKTDSHAEDIITIVREVFGEGNAFCRKITHKSEDDPKSILGQFRNEFYPRIAVTVDMIATGTDVKPLECLLFLRDVKSANYFEQMKGRGTRTLSQEELSRVSRSARTDKTHFVIVDAVGVTRSRKTDSHTLDKKPTVPLKDLMMSVMMGSTDDDVLTTLAGRLARLNRQMSDNERASFSQHAGGTSIETVTHALLDAADPDAIETRARQDHRVPEDKEPTETQLEEARTALVDAARKPFTGKLVDYVENVRRIHEQTIDSENPDQVISTGWMDDQDERARDTVKEFEQYLADHRDELDALRIWYGEPQRRRAITVAMVKELLASIRENRPTLAPVAVWDAYAHLDNLKSERPDKELTVLVAVVRRAVGLDETLTPYDASVRRRFQDWILRRNAGPVQFSEDQTAWLRRIRDQIALSVSVELEDLNYAPFGADGGVARHYQLFGDHGEEILDEINREVGA